MNWHKQSLRLNTDNERARDTFIAESIDDIDFLVSLLVERKRLIEIMGEQSDGPEVNKLKEIWERYPPNIQFLAVNKHNGKEF